MQITINGKQKEFVDSANLKNIIDQFCRNTAYVIAEVNGQIIKSQHWNERVLKNGDTIELIKFVGGG